MLYEELKRNKIFCRRYFYPLISNFSTYRGLPSSKRTNLPVANSVSEKVLCLPLYSDIDINTLDLIIELMINDGK